MSIARRNLRSLLCFLLAAVILSAFFLPVTVKATHTYRFLNPLGTVEPRLETPLADRQGVIDILNGTGERTLRLGVAWYYKPLDAEPPYAIAEMLKEKWEKEHPGLTVKLVIPDPEAQGIGSELPADTQYIPAVGHAWNIRADIVYDTWAEKVDAIIMGVGD